MEKVLYDGGHLKVIHDEQNDWLYFDWVGFQTEEQSKIGGDKMIEYLKNTNCTKILNDNTRLSGAWGSSVDRVADSLIPNLIKIGLSSFAWVYSGNTFANLSTQRVIKKVNEKYKNHFFMCSDIAQAKKWLQRR